MSRSGCFSAYRGSWLALGFGLSACAGGFDPAHFSGSREERRVEPEAVLEVAASSSELELLGNVHASCRLQRGFRRLDGEALSDVDCSVDRLKFALRESAASAGGELLVGLRCNSRGSGAPSRPTEQLSCVADVARFSAGAVASQRPLSVPRSLPTGAPAPSAAEVKRIDEPDASLAFRITLDFVPRVSKYERRARANGGVSELSLMPLADHALGDLQARCADGCDPLALRRSVLIAAGRLGAPDVVAVRCFELGAERSCVGTLAAPEREE